MTKHLLATGALLLALGTGGAQATEQALAYQVVDGGIPTPLTSTPGDAANGAKVMINRKLGNCLACHEVTAMNDQPFHGKVGPTLDGAAERYSEAELRLIVVNSKQVFEGTIMPGFYRLADLSRVASKFEGKTILDAQQVEDVVAYLKTLQE